MKGRIKGVVIWILMILSLILVIKSAMASAIPTSINVQGVLKDASDNGYLAGNYDFVFKIYNQSSGGTALYTKSVTLSTDANGIYSAILDNVGINFNEPRWLGVKVDTDDEMTPRLNFTVAPFAFNSKAHEEDNETIWKTFFGSSDLNETYARLYDINHFTQNVSMADNLTVGGSVLFVDSSSGRVGIGTTSPGAKLEVYEGASAGSFQTHTDIGIQTSPGDYGMFEFLADSGSANEQYILFSDKDAPTASIYYKHSTDKLHFTTGGWSAAETRLLIDSSGNVGIGTTTPDYPLEVYGNTSKDNGTISIFVHRNISATGYITRTSKWDKSLNVWDYVKDSDYYLDIDNEIDHKKFYGYAGVSEFTDLSRPVSEEYLGEECNETWTEKVRQECAQENVYREVCVNVTTNVCNYELIGQYYQWVCGDVSEEKCSNELKQNCTAYYEEECNYEGIYNNGILLGYDYVCGNVEKQGCIPIMEQVCNDVVYNEEGWECGNVTKFRTIYPYKVEEEGVLLDKEIDALRQAVYELKVKNDLIKLEICKFVPAKWC